MAPQQYIDIIELSPRIWRSTVKPASWLGHVGIQKWKSKAPTGSKDGHHCNILPPPDFFFWTFVEFGNGSVSALRIEHPEMTTVKRSKEYSRAFILHIVFDHKHWLYNALNGQMMASEHARILSYLIYNSFQFFSRNVPAIVWPSSVRCNPHRVIPVPPFLKPGCTKSWKSCCCRLEDLLNACSEPHSPGTRGLEHGATARLLP